MSKKNRKRECEFADVTLSIPSPGHLLTSYQEDATQEKAWVDEWLAAWNGGKAGIEEEGGWIHAWEASPETDDWVWVEDAYFHVDIARLVKTFGDSARWETADPSACIAGREVERWQPIHGKPKPLAELD